MTESAAADQPAPGRPARRRLTVLLVAVIAVALVALGGGLAVALGIGSTATPGTDSVDAGFSRDMSRHHLQAVEMANLAATRSDDTDVQRLAFDIASGQTNQVGRMQGWLSLWGLSVNGGELMGWMTGSSDDGAAGMDMGSMDDEMTTARARGALMPGMATEDELSSLRAASGTDFDVLFLQLMIRHHEGGLQMAEYGETHAQVAAVRTLARSIAQTQTAEVQTMTDMLTAKGGAPLPAD